MQIVLRSEWGAPARDALYSAGIVGRACAICQRPNPLTTAGTRQGAAGLALRRQHHAVEVLRLAAEIAGRADVEALVGRTRLHDLVRQDLDPVAVDLDLVVGAHL